MMEMTPQFYYGEYWQIDTGEGMIYLPCPDTISEWQVDKTIEKEGMKAGWALLANHLPSTTIHDDQEEAPPSREGQLYRLSANGYTDHTDWMPCGVYLASAIQDLMDMYDDYTSPDVG